MTRKELVEIIGSDVESETIDQILDKYHVELNAKTDSLKSELDEVRADLKSANSTIRKLQKDNPDIEDLQKQIQSYQDKYEKLKQERLADQKKHDEELIHNAMEKDLIKAGVRDIKSAMVHYDLSKIKIDENREVTGIEEQTKTIVEEKPFLFGKLDTVSKPQQEYTPKEGKETKVSFGTQLARKHIEQQEKQRAMFEEANKFFEH